MAVDLVRIAELSRIYFSPEDLSAMEKDMASIIELMDSLSGVELPTDEDSLEREIKLSMLREDAIRPGLPADLLTSQSPEGNDFKMPRIVE